MFERVKYYVRYEHLSKAKPIVEELFNAQPQPTDMMDVSGLFSGAKSQSRSEQYNALAVMLFLRRRVAAVFTVIR